MTKKQKKTLIRILISAFLFIVCIAPLFNEYVDTLFLISSYLIIGFDVLKKAGRNILHGKVFDENFLMSIATIGAIFTGQYHEAVFVMLFYQVGELFQSVAVGKSRKSIANLMEIRPDCANVIRDGKEISVHPSEILKGEILTVRAGEKIPLDSIIIEGSTDIDTKALTGESALRECLVGDEVLSGCVNISGVIKLKVVKEFEESTVSKILELVENASCNKSKSESFITRFAAVYTPIVVYCALALAVIPPLFIGFNNIAIWKDWIYRALTFLVISCPCALVISVPLSFFGGIGGLSKHGVLVKGSNYIEALGNCKTIAFDKTGTLTHGSFSISECKCCEISEDELKLLAAAAESHSNHPIAKALKMEGITADSAYELAGLGVCANYNGMTIHAGNAKLMKSLDIKPYHTDFTAVHIAKSGKYAGCIILTDTIKKEAKTALEKLHTLGVNQTVMLTGDSKATADAVARKLGITKVFSKLMPTDKVYVIESLLDDGTVAFVGDGINDAPVLARADIGIAMGALGSDAAIEAADVVLMDDNLEKLATAIEISRFTQKIVIQNIIFTLSVKIIVLIMGALGLTGMWAAVFADVGVAVIAILNAMRTLK